MSDALVRSATGRMPTVWWHSTDRTTLLVGPADRRTICEPVPDDLLVVRRPSGGGAVLAGKGVLGLDIVLPSGHPLLTGDVVLDYRWVGETWRTALGYLGVQSRVLEIDEARALNRDLAEPVVESLVRLACFGAYSPFEVVVGRRKIVGLSQARRSGSTLIASGIHLDFDVDGIVRALGVPASVRASVARTLADRGTGLREIVGHTQTEDVIMVAFRRALREQLGVSLRRGEWTRAELARGRADVKL